MVKFVVAGSADCPYFAKLELLADQLSKNLPEFEVHKIVKQSNEWQPWLSETCDRNGWKHDKSPIVWRELVDRGGKGLLMGGYNDFMEYANCYYGVTSKMLTPLALKIEGENVAANKQDLEEEIEFQNSSQPLHICIVNASNPTAYHFIPRLVSGEIFGDETEISIRLYDDIKHKDNLDGIVMEMMDLAFPLLRKVEFLTDLESAFKGATAVIFLDNNNDSENTELYKKYAAVLDKHALADVKVIVAGGGSINLNAHTLVENTTNISKRNIVASSRLQERRARSNLARKLEVNSAGVRDVIVWGDCATDGSGTGVHVGLDNGSVHGYNGAITGPEWFSRKLTEVVYDTKWLADEFLSSLSQHKTKLCESLRHDPSLSEASSLASLMRDWVQGSKSSEMFSLGVECEGWYGINDCVFSLPVKFEAGSYSVVWDLELDSNTKEKLKKIESELKNSTQVEVTQTSPVKEPVATVTDSLAPTPSSGKLEAIKEE